jgi:hypothetical protein
MRTEELILVVFLTLALAACSKTYHCKIEAVVDLTTKESRPLPALIVFTFSPEVDTGTMVGGEALGLLAKGPANSEGGYMSPYVAMVKMDGTFRDMTLSNESTGAQLHASGKCREM